jgi:hypothetical protein
VTVLSGVYNQGGGCPGLLSPLAACFLCKEEFRILLGCKERDWENWTDFLLEGLQGLQILLHA